MISLWKRFYGESPLHLLGQLVAFAVAAYAIKHVVDIRSTDNLNLVVWFVAGAILHDALFVPIYLTLDLISRLGIQDHALRDVRVINHLRFPLVISGVLFMTTFPLILGKNIGPFTRTARVRPPDDYLARWLLVTAIVFAISAVSYAVRLRLAAVRASRPAPAEVEAEQPTVAA